MYFHTKLLETVVTLIHFVIKFETSLKNSEPTEFLKLNSPHFFGTVHYHFRAIKMGT